MKVYFVGMHNKPNMLPLDSRTMSGKMIDAVINELPYECVKTNLCEVEYFPQGKEEIWQGNLSWSIKYDPRTTDIICLLGQWVQKNFFTREANIVKLPHPASCMGNVNKENYIKTAIERINSAINSPSKVNK